MEKVVLESRLKSRLEKSTVAPAKPRRLKAVRVCVMSAAFSADGSSVLTASDDKTERM